MIATKIESQTEPVLDASFSQDDIFMRVKGLGSFFTLQVSHDDALKYTNDGFEIQISPKNSASLTLFGGRYFLETGVARMLPERRDTIGNLIDKRILLVFEGNEWNDNRPNHGDQFEVLVTKIGNRKAFETIISGV